MDLKKVSTKALLDRLATLLKGRKNSTKRLFKAVKETEGKTIQ